MDSLFRLFKHKSTHGEQNVANITDFLEFQSGNRVGFPADVVCFEFNSKLGYAVLATAHGEVVIYGANGITFSCDLNEGRCVSSKKFMPVKIVFMAGKTTFILCKEGLLVKLELGGNRLFRLIDIGLQVPKTFKWELVQVQKSREESYHLIYVNQLEIGRIEQDTLDVEELLTVEDFDRWSNGQQDLAIQDILVDCHNPEILLVLVKDGVVGIYRDRELREKLSMVNADGSTVQKLIWSPTNNFAYAIGSNSKYTKWRLDFSRYETLILEIDGPVYDQAEPYPVSDMFHFGALADTEHERAKTDIVFYQGGRNRSNYDDAALVTVRQGRKCVAFEVTGELVTVCGVPGGWDGHFRNGLIFLITANELVAIDLDTEDWKTMRPQHFMSMNNSFPTAQTRTYNITADVWENLLDISNKYWMDLNFSTRTWPLTFGAESVVEFNRRSVYKQVHLTGHSSGAIYVWAAGGLHMRLLYIIRTATEFLNFTPPNQSGALAQVQGNDDIPQAKVGEFDPYDDDPNLAITQLHFNHIFGTVIAVNCGGYIFHYALQREPTDLGPVYPKKMSIELPSCSNTNTLIPRNYEHTYPSGYQPYFARKNDETVIFQICPNVPVTAIAYFQYYGCLAIGTDCGFMFLDLKNRAFVKYVPYHIEEGANRSEANRPSRYKSLKKSLRRTFRKKRRSDSTTLNASSSTRKSPNSTAISHRTMTSPGGPGDDVRHVERMIEARTDLPDAAPTWVITCMKVLRIPFVQKLDYEDILVIGTSGGKVLFYKFEENPPLCDIPMTSGYVNEVSFNIKKLDTIKFSTPAPIVSIDLTTEHGYYAAELTRLLIFTDDQIRVYNFPGLQKSVKYKITSNEGVRIKSGAAVQLTSTVDKSTMERFALIVTNEGHLRVHSLQDPAYFERLEFLNQFDLMGITSIVLSKNGEVTFLKRSSEIIRNSINALDRAFSSKLKL